MKATVVGRDKLRVFVCPIDGDHEFLAVISRHIDDSWTAAFSTQVIIGLTPKQQREIQDRAVCLWRAYDSGAPLHEPFQLRPSDAVSLQLEG